MMQLVYRAVLQWGVTGLKSKGCWFEPTDRHYISSNNVCLLAYIYIFTGEDPQSEWVKRDESNT